MRRAAAVVGCLVLLAGVALVGRPLLRNHQNYGVWAWRVTSPTPKLTYRGRHYLLTGAEDRTALAMLPVGSTPDGYQILGPAGPQTAEELVVVLPSGGRHYDLAGGP